MTNPDNDADDDADEDESLVMFMCQPPFPCASIPKGTGALGELKLFMANGSTYHNYSSCFDDFEEDGFLLEELQIHACSNKITFLLAKVRVTFWACWGCQIDLFVFFSGYTSE